MLWQGLTGTLPFDNPLAEQTWELPDLQELRADIPEWLAQLVDACLRERPENRPDSAAMVARALRDGVWSEPTTPMVSCQACGDPLPGGLRICLSCGKEAIRFRHAPLSKPGFDVVLLGVQESAEAMGALRHLLESLSDDTVPPLLFSQRRSSSSKQKSEGLMLPSRLVRGLDERSATELLGRLSHIGASARIVPSRPIEQKDMKLESSSVLGWAVSWGTAAFVTLAACISVWLLGAIIPLLFLVFIEIFLRPQRWNHRRKVASLIDLELKEEPAALPASDPLVRRLAALLPAGKELETILKEMAILLQRLVDHRGRLQEDRAQRAELEWLTEPLEPLVDLVVTQTTQLKEIDAELDQLDEGRLIRAVASSEARGEAASLREPLLLGLDRLRDLETERAAILHRLLEAGSLIRRAAELVLEVRDDRTVHEAEIRLAIAALR